MEGDNNLESLMNEVKSKIGELIQKPKMSDKLLSKPPFRFLHDTITAISSATGFGEGLYNEVELDSAAMTDKQAKLAYLDKIFNLIGICKGKQLEVKAVKVVSGLEPENTNLFLIALAECASDPKYDSQQAVRLCLNGAQPGEHPPPLKQSTVAESKSDHSSGSSSKAQQNSEIIDSKIPNGGAKDSDAKIPEMEVVAPERGKSRGGTRGGKPQLATADTGLSGFANNSKAPNLDKEIERCDGTEATTQLLLGELIQRPKLSEKLLSKPPFRFLHDIIMEVMKVTGFGNDLYIPAEMDSAAISDKTQKVTFLEKIIKVVGVQLNTLVEAKPMKIVAGMDPQNTNNFLQLLAVAAKHMPDSRIAVRTVLEQLGGEVPPSNGNDEVGAKESAAAPINTEPPQKEQVREEKKPSGDDRNKFKQSQPPPTIGAEPKESARQDTERTEDKTNMDDNDGDGGEMKRSARPTTARRRPPKVKDGAKELQAKDIAPASKKAEGIIIDGAADEDEDDVIPDESRRLYDDMRTDAKSAGQADPQSKLVKDIMSRQTEQEVAGRGTNKNEPVEETKSSPTNDTNSGSGIRLGKLRKTGIEKKQTGKDGTNNLATTENDLEKMRKSIQILVQHTGPLGTCMDYIQEDIKMMSDELRKWEEECTRYEAEYEDAKRKTKEVLQPLKQELREIENQIIEQISKISSTKANNARNDEKIQSILKLIATA
eukprot:gene8130-11008_t